MGEASRQPVQALGALIVLWIAAYWVRSPAGSAMLDEPVFEANSSADRETDVAMTRETLGPAIARGSSAEPVRDDAVDRVEGPRAVSEGTRANEFDWSPGGGSDKPVSGAGETEPDRPAVRTHTVRRGDTLGSISLRAYGSVRFAQAIYRANRGILRSPDALDEGMVLTLPENPSP